MKEDDGMLHQVLQVAEAIVQILQVYTRSSSRSFPVKKTIRNTSSVAEPRPELEIVSGSAAPLKKLDNFSLHKKSCSEKKKFFVFQYLTELEWKNYSYLVACSEV